MRELQVTTQNLTQILDYIVPLICSDSTTKNMLSNHKLLFTLIFMQLSGFYIQGFSEDSTRTQINFYF